MRQTGALAYDDAKSATVSTARVIRGVAVFYDQRSPGDAIISVDTRDAV